MKGVLKTIGIVFAVALAVYLPVSYVLSIGSAHAATAAVNQSSKEQDVLPLPETLDDIEQSLQSNEFTPETYVPPAYDPFDNQYYDEPDTFEELIKLSDRAANSSPTASFQVRTDTRGLASVNSGTTDTLFTFDAHGSSDGESRTTDIKVRWDYDSDGEADTFFSKTKTTRHRFEEAGVYEVTLEVMDEGGLTNKTSQTIQIVNNTIPYAYFTFSPTEDTEGNIFTFKTDHSYDDQYETSMLEFRFDWNGDGIWDTPFKSKTTWNHQYEEAGVYTVVMMVKDPEGLTDVSTATITVTKNEPPVARISVEAKEIEQAYGNAITRYYFDASSSTDPDGQKLQYRWDYNYTGPDDINFDTSFTYGSKSNGYYEISGDKTVRLQVRDENGAIGEAFVHFTVN